MKLEIYELPKPTVDRFSWNHGFVDVLDGAMPQSLINHAIDVEDSEDMRHYFTDNHGMRITSPTNYRSRPTVLGSKRVGYESKPIADVIYSALSQYVPRIKEDEHGVLWRLVGCNPYMRLMRYTKGTGLHPHRDGNYEYGSDGEIKNLMSVIIYLTDNDSGCTRFIHDRSDAELVGFGQSNLAIAKDWKNMATEDDCLYSVKPVRGRVAVFDTNMLHESQLLEDDADKVVLLTELAYERIDVPNAKAKWGELSW